MWFSLATNADKIFLSVNRDTTVILVKLQLPSA